MDESKKKVVKNLMDKMTEKGRQSLFEQLLLIDAESLHRKALAKSYDMALKNELCKEEDYSYEKASALFDVSTKDISVFINPILDGILRDNAKEYEEIYEHLNKLTELFTRAYVRMFALPVFKHQEPSLDRVEEEEVQVLRNNANFSLSIDKMKKEVERKKAAEQALYDLKNFDMSSFKK